MEQNERETLQLCVTCSNAIDIAAKYCPICGAQVAERTSGTLAKVQPGDEHGTNSKSVAS
jgi:hypothetical protein